MITMGILWYLFFSPGEYHIKIERDYNTEKEKISIEVAEEFDYSSIFNISRFDPEFHYNNYIDSEVISNYSAVIEERREKNDQSYNSLRYKAEALSLSTCRINCNRNSLCIESDNKSYIESHFFDDHVWYSSMIAIFNDTYMRIAYQIHDDIQINLTNVILVRMELAYAHSWGSLAAVYSDTYQYIILDEDFEPIFIAIKYYHTIS